MIKLLKQRNACAMIKVVLIHKNIAPKKIRLEKSKRTLYCHKEKDVIRCTIHLGHLIRSYDKKA